MVFIAIKQGLVKDIKAKQYKMKLYNAMPPEY